MLEQSNLCCEGAGQGLSVTDQTSGCESEVVTNLEQLLNALVGDEVAHGSPVVRSYNDAAVEGDANCACSSFHYGRLVLHHHQSLLHADTS